MSRIRTQHGYTIVELILAMAVFSFVMVIMSTAVVNLFHIYQSGAQIRVTQQAARSIGEMISSDARSAQRIVAVDSNATFTAPVGSGSAQPGTPIAIASRICLIADTKQTSTGFTHAATVYELPSLWNAGAYDVHARYTLQKTDNVSLKVTTNTAEVPSDLSNACRSAVVSGGGNVTPSDVGVAFFKATDTGGNLLNLQLGVVAVNGLPEVDYVDDINNGGSGGVCLGGAGNQYCSITNLIITAGPKGGWN